MQRIFKYHKSSLRMLLRIFFIFCQFQPSVAYKNVAYKKTMYLRKTKRGSYPYHHWSAHIYAEQG